MLLGMCGGRLKKSLTNKKTPSNQQMINCMDRLIEYNKEDIDDVSIVRGMDGDDRQGKIMPCERWDNLFIQCNGGGSQGAFLFIRSVRWVKDTRIVCVKTSREHVCNTLYSFVIYSSIFNELNINEYI